MRWDPITGEPLLVAPGRMARPHDTGRTAPADTWPPSDGPSPKCPFCPGAEHETPPELWADRAPDTAADSPGWRVRVVPNRFPLLPPDEGVHEVIINTHRHVFALWDLTPSEMARAIDAWARRERALRTDARALWPFLFLNQGAAAGASLQHTHAQLLGFPFPPPRLLAREQAFCEALTCPICNEFADPNFALITEIGPLVAWCPQTPTLSGAVRIGPRLHIPEWPARPGDDLAAIMGPVMRELCGVVGTSAANLWLHQRRDHGPDALHWHIEIIPRRGTLAGMELGAGVFSLLNEPNGLAQAIRAGI